jgi:hypothetical protein
LDSHINAEMSSALLAFNSESFLYCKGISDTVTQEYAVAYAKMLLNRMQGLEPEYPRTPPRVFEPNLKLIRSFLDRVFDKHFPRRVRG